MNDNYVHDLNTFQSLQKRARLFMILSPIIVIVGVITLYTLVSMVIASFGTFSMTYVCEGVDENWLVSHPFKTEGLPLKVKAGTEYTLEPVTIEGYQFQGWYVNGRTSALKDNVLKYSDTSSSYLGGMNIFSDRKVSARYEPIDYSVMFDLNGGNIVVDSNSSFDGKKYLRNKTTGIIFTTYICTEKEFNLPLATKDGKTFAGWENKNGGDLVVSCTPSSCKSYTLVAKWS